MRREPYHHYVKCFVLALFVASSSVSCTSGESTQGGAETWKPFDSAAGKYSVHLPKPPLRSKSNSYPTQFGEITTHYIEGDYQGVVYRVSYTDLPEQFFQVMKPPVVLDKLMMSTVGDKYQLLTKEPSEFQGFPELYLELGTAESDRLMLVRNILVDGRHYKLNALIHRSKEASERVVAKRLLDSFQLKSEAAT